MKNAFKPLFLTGAAVAVIGLSVLSASAKASDLMPGMEDLTAAEAEMINVKGESVGKITLDEGINGVVLRYELYGLPTGERSIHLHETGDCTPVQTEGATGTNSYFTNAGSHLELSGQSHGFLHDYESAPHAGDLPNIMVDGEGRVLGYAFNDRITVNGKSNSDHKARLLDQDGSAIIIHSGKDDYKSQPTGNAGDRIACGVIKAE